MLSRLFKTQYTKRVNNHDAHGGEQASVTRSTHAHISRCFGGTPVNFNTTRFSFVISRLHVTFSMKFIINCSEFVWKGNVSDAQK
jgi:hypothetical protein